MDTLRPYCWTSRGRLEGHTIGYGRIVGSDGAPSTMTSARSPGRSSAQCASSSAAGWDEVRIPVGRGGAPLPSPVEKYVAANEESPHPDSAKYVADASPVRNMSGAALSRGGRR
jgi:hypothetical protein